MRNTVWCHCDSGGDSAEASVANPASDFEYTESDGEITITKLKNTEMRGVVVIPRTIDGLPVTRSEGVL